MTQSNSKIIMMKINRIKKFVVFAIMNFEYYNYLSKFKLTLFFNIFYYKLFIYGRCNMKYRYLL